MGPPPQSCSYCSSDGQSRLEFFKVFLPSFSSHRLHIPPDFVKQMKGKIPNEATLEDYYGRTWSVQLIETESGLFIKKGWEEFATDNSLKFGDFLVFYYDSSRSVFHVKTFGRNGCKKQAVCSTSESPVSNNIEDEEEVEETPERVEEPSFGSGLNRRARNYERKDSDLGISKLQSSRMCKEAVCPASKSLVMINNEDEEKVEETRERAEETSVGGRLNRQARNRKRKYSDLDINKLHSSRLHEACREQPREGIPHEGTSKDMLGKRAFPASESPVIINIDDEEEVEETQERVDETSVGGRLNRRARNCKRKYTNLDISKLHSSRLHVASRELPKKGVFTKGTGQNRPGKEFAPKRPYFVAVVNNSNIIRMSIPNAFLKEHKIRMMRAVTLRDQNGKLWPARIKHGTQERTSFSTGWNEFQHKNLRVNDMCLFEFVLGEGNKCSEVIVRVSRSGLRLKRHNRYWVLNV